jgi:hypothetical protein
MHADHRMRQNGAMNAARLLLLASLLVLASCATKQHSRDLLNVALYDYQSAIRWGNFTGALDFLDPQVLAKKPVTAIDLKRYEQIQVTGYTVQGAGSPAEGQHHQVVEIRFINRHTQAERAVLDQQQWRYDAEQRRWWLVTGLPDITAR